MTVKFTDLPSLAAVDIADDDVLAVSDISAAASKKVTVADLLSSIADLTQLQVEDPASTVFGQVSGERLSQAVAASVDVASELNATGSAPIYACRAWVNADGSPVTIRGSGNVSSITDLGVGYHQINFTTAMQDVNYCVSATTGTSNAFPIVVSVQTTYVRIQNPSRGSDINDPQYLMVAIHR